MEWSSVMASGKGVTVPANVGCIHINKVNINPETEKRGKTNTMRIHCTTIVYMHVSVRSLPVRRDAQVFVEQSTQEIGILLVLSSTNFANTVKGAESAGVSFSSKHHHLVSVDMYSNVLKENIIQHFHELFMDFGKTLFVQHVRQTCDNVRLSEISTRDKLVCA